MIRTASSPILRVIRNAVEDQHAKGLSDRELLGRFIAHCDQCAFHALLRRHARIVLDVCRCVLRNEADAEDAFQATFLVFARKAKTIRKAMALGSWLYGVAYRTALKAQAEFARRRKHEGRVPQPTAAESTDDLSWHEVKQIVLSELNSLPEVHRSPLVLCYLQGKTQDEAADQLGLPKGTLKGRLERGRALHRERLVGRGLGTAGLLVASAWPAVALSASTVRPALMSSTAQAATASAAGKVVAGIASARVVALSEGVLKAMFTTKLCVAAVSVSSILVMTAVGILGFHAAAGPQPPVAVAKVQASQKPAPPETKRQPAEQAADKDEPPMIGNAVVVANKGAVSLVGGGVSVDAGSVKYLEFKPDGTQLVKHLEFSPDGTQLIRPPNPIDRFIDQELHRQDQELHRQELHRKAYLAFLRELKLDLFEALPTPAEMRLFREGTGKQRAAAINDMFLRAAKENKWDDAKLMKTKERVLELLLDFDSDPQKHGIPAKPKDSKEPATRLSPEQRELIERWIHGR